MPFVPLDHVLTFGASEARRALIVTASSLPTTAAASAAADKSPPACLPGVGDSGAPSGAFTSGVHAAKDAPSAVRTHDVTGERRNDLSMAGHQPD